MAVRIAIGVAAMTDDFEPIETVDLVGGAFCLDFTNTASSRGTVNQRERLLSYSDLITWGERTTLLDAATATHLRALAGTQPDVAEHVRVRAIAVREVIYRIFAAISHGERPDSADLTAFNSLLVETARHRRLVEGEACCQWQWIEGDEPLERVLWPVVQSAADLLTGPELDRVKICMNDPCSWLFLDASRNRSRRWCDMNDCGNRAKARRHYARKKESNK
jgi:predicted RNA-binding Zn ribbon-like protein